MATDHTLELAISKRLRDITLEVSLSLAPGVAALVGPSGAGKSTLLRLIAGLLRPDTGTVRLGGALLDDANRRYHLPPWQRGLGVVFQEYALFPHLDVRENVAYGLRARHTPREGRRRRVDDVLARLGIASLATQRPDRLSGGQRQRVALARALVLDPHALLLDEPLAALDATTRAAVRHDLRETLRGLPIPVVLVTHDYADALTFRERIIIMADGKIVQDGPHEELLARPRSRFVADFTGVNFYEGRLEAQGDGHVARVTLPGGVEVFVPADSAPPGPVGLTLHPWEVVLSAQPPGGSARNVLAGQVREALPLGGRVRVVLAAGPGGVLPLVAEITPDALQGLDCHEGQVLYASFKATAIALAPL